MADLTGVVQQDNQALTTSADAADGKKYIASDSGSAASGSGDSDTWAGLGLTGLLGTAAGNFFGKWAGTNQNSGVDYNALAGMANGAYVDGLTSAKEGDALNKSVYKDQIAPAVTSQLGIANRVSGSMENTANALTSNATSDRELASGFDPVTKQYAGEAAAYGGASDQESAAAKAAGTALQQSQAAKSSALNTLTDMGVDTGSGKLASTLMQADMQAATNAASAANNAREQTRLAGINLRGQATQQGSALKQAATAEATQGAQVGAAAANTAGTGITSAIQGANLATSGTNDILNADNMGINANLGLAKVKSADNYNYAVLNNKSSSDLSKGVVQSGVTTPIVNWLGKTVTGGLNSLVNGSGSGSSSGGSSSTDIGGHGQDAAPVPNSDGSNTDLGGYDSAPIPNSDSSNSDLGGYDSAPIANQDPSWVDTSESGWADSSEDWVFD